MNELRHNKNKTTSIILIWILVVSGIFILNPIFQPKAGAIINHNISAAYEDSDFGGGIDYNGDIAGDGKVTWHAVDNPHIMDDHFFVEDDFILEIEEGVVLLVDPGFRIQVGQTKGARLFANGTSGNPIMIGPNGTGDWDGIYLLSGSYGSIQGTWMDQFEWVYVGDSSLDINASIITNTNSVGLYGTGSSINATLAGIFNTNAPGLYVTNSNLFASNCFIADAPSAAIYCDSSVADIRYSDLYGFNSSAGLDGGHGIYVTGASSQVLVSNNNNIIGGNGGPDGGSGGGDGGFGIFHSSYDGQLNIEGNIKIQGGKGGDNFSPGLSAGDGGLGIHINPLSDLAPPPAIYINGNTRVLGGRGGDNNAVIDGNAGRGGSAIRISDDPVGSSGEAVIMNNMEVIGGGGGHNHADSVSTGWTAGDGGEGISISGVKNPASVFVDQNPNIQGGAGGNNTGAGNSATVAGEGGAGILLWNATDVTIQESMIIGGHGGNNTETGIMASAGEGGNGVFLYYPSSDFQSSAQISGCTMYGGEGGDNFNVSPSLEEAGGGGSGLYSSQGSGSCESSEIAGGKGGDNFGLNGTGGSGGYGAAFASSMAWNVFEGAITGGKGGSNYNADGGGGKGGIATFVSGSSVISYSTISYIRGGDGGDVDIGDSGPGNSATASIYILNSFDISLLRNDIVTGVGGLNSSSGEYGANGTYCIYAENLDGSNTIMENDITTNFRGSGTYAMRILLIPSASVAIEGNGIYTNNVGIYIQNSDSATLIVGNYIYDNDFGVYLFSSYSTMGPNNIISNNGYGVYCYDSSPTITEDQISDSSTVGVFFTSDSNAILEDCIIENSNVWNVYSEGGSGAGSSPQFYNCSLSAGSTGGEFYQSDDSHPWLLNTTFDKTRTGFGDEVSNITVNWFMHILVIDTTYTEVPGATVWVNDTYGFNVHTLLTDGNGWSKWNIITEYIENTSGYEYYYTPHNVSALEGGRFGNAIPRMILSRDVIIMLDGINYEIPVKKGWNMISIAINHSSTQLEDVLRFLDGKYEAVQWFNIGDPSDSWKDYHVSKAPQFNDLTDIYRTMGIWILMKNDDILSIAGQVPIPSTTDIGLKTGWNFVGYPSLTSRISGVGIGEAFESISGLVNTVQYFDSFDPADYWKEWDPGLATPDDLTNINPGMGLWIHVSGDCTWTVDW